MMFVIGKLKALGKIKDNPLQLLGRADSNEEGMMQEAKKFVAACYGGKNISSSANRLSTLTLWQWISVQG